MIARAGFHSLVQVTGSWLQVCTDDPLRSGAELIPQQVVDGGCLRLLYLVIGCKKKKDNFQLARAIVWKTHPLPRSQPVARLSDVKLHCISRLQNAVAKNQAWNKIAG